MVRVIRTCSPVSLPNDVGLGISMRNSGRRSRRPYQHLPPPESPAHAGKPAIAARGVAYTRPAHAVAPGPCRLAGGRPPLRALVGSAGRFLRAIAGRDPEKDPPQPGADRRPQGPRTRADDRHLPAVEPDQLAAER